MTVGAQLQQARQSQQRSVADVTAATKIQPWVVEALEADTLQQTMSLIYVKAFLTTYAKFLQLEPAALLAQLPSPSPAEPVQVATPPPATRAPLTVQFPWHWLRLLRGPAAVCAVIAALVLINPLRWLPKVHGLTFRAPALASFLPVHLPSKPAALPTLVLIPARPLELSVTAKSTTWIRVRADGKLLTQQKLSRGAQERWVAKKRFEIIVAKPSQVELTVNGQPLTPHAIAHQGRFVLTHYGVANLSEDDF